MPSGLQQSELLRTAVRFILLIASIESASTGCLGLLEVTVLESQGEDSSHRSEGIQVHVAGLKARHHQLGSVLVCGSLSYRPRLCAA